jgi:LPXTG-motif cell wall-anchored protein
MDPDLWFVPLLLAITAAGGIGLLLKRKKRN